MLVTCRLLPHLLMCGAPTTERDAPSNDRAVRVAAQALVRNATEMARRERHGAYADEASLVYTFVSPAMLSAVERALE